LTVPYKLHVSTQQKIYPWLSNTRILAGIRKSTAFRPTRELLQAGESAISVTGGWKPNVIVEQKTTINRNAKAARCATLNREGPATTSRRAAYYRLATLITPGAINSITGPAS
jgi:hypothetical protein